MSSKSEEIAEAIWIIIARLFKWACVIVFGLVTFVAVAGGGYWLYGYFTYDLPASRVLVTVIEHEDGCRGADGYLEFVVKNNSSKTVIRVSAALKAAYQQRSENRLKPGASAETDLIIRPGETAKECVRRPAMKPRDLFRVAPSGDYVWSVTNSHVTFQE